MIANSVVFMPLVLLPLVQFSKPEAILYMPMVHSRLWCCNTWSYLSYRNETFMQLDG